MLKKPRRSVAVVFKTYDLIAINQKAVYRLVYNYDIENRLTSIEINTATTGSYVYDESGQRVKKTANGVTTKFVGGLYESTGTANAKHLFAAGMRVATIENNVPVYYHADHLGSANVLTDDSGTKVDVMEYEPFGELSRHDMTENQEEGYLYTDQYRDNESELYYYNARYYNPSIGRFITPDWIVQAPSHSQSFNRYSYVWNNPINAIDPTGNTVRDFVVGAFKGAAKTAVGAVDFIVRLPEHGDSVGTYIGERIVDLKRNPEGAIAETKAEINQVIEGYKQLLSTDEGRGELFGSLTAGFALGKFLPSTARSSRGTKYSSGAAHNAANYQKLKQTLAFEEAASLVTAEGKLTQEAIKGAKEIMNSSKLNNLMIPEGFSKFTTRTFNSPQGRATTRFYQNPQTGEVLYGLDYKTILLDKQ